MLRGNKFKSSLIIIIAAAALSTGCGSQSYLNKPQSKSKLISSGSNSTPVVLASPTPSGSADLLGVPPYSFRVGAVGYTSTRISVRTNSVLKLRFTPGIQDEKVRDSNGNLTGFSPRYSHLGVYVEVEGNAQPTRMLSNGLVSAAESDDFDLSTSFTRACTSAEPNCRQDVEIVIKQPNYDYWCLNYGMYCSWTHVESTHPWHGTVLVQTDDTDPIPAQ